MRKIVFTALLVGTLFTVGCATPSVSQIKVKVIPPSVPWQPYPSVELNATVLK